MPSCKSHPVPAFYNTPEPPQPLPMLSSQTEMYYQPRNPVTVTAKEEMYLPIPAPTLSGATTKMQRVTTTNSRATTPRAVSPITKPSGRSVTINEGGVETSDSPSPSESTLSSLDEDDEESSNKIPKPAGEVGRPGRGGYNLEEKMGWGEDSFKKLKVNLL